MKAKISVDFNELVDFDLILLSQSDLRKDIDGNDIILTDGQEIEIYDIDYDDHGRDDLIANGHVEVCKLQGYSHVKWCCRINFQGIRHMSELA